MALTKGELKILKSIVVASENNPRKPEFPAENPKFPATPTYKMKVPGFNNVWLKDESKNPTGTHKDRMAWEIIVTYRHILLAKQRGQISGPLPRMSLISSGSAALAIQTQFNKYKLPPLKVLADYKLHSDIKIALERVGAEVYEVDLSRRLLKTQDILQITRNENGFDITSAEALDPTTRFYDWLSYEILNSSPEYCFVPFGTGNLYENILNVTKREVTGSHHDPRFKGNVRTLQQCHFLGATTNSPASLATKLYSPHLPFVHYNEQWIRLYRTAGYCGSKSDVYVFQEKFLQQALKLTNEQNIQCEPSGIAGLALLLQMRRQIPSKAKILIINTGKTKYTTAPNVKTLARHANTTANK